MHGWPEPNEISKEGVTANTFSCKKGFPPQAPGSPPAQVIVEVSTKPNFSTEAAAFVAGIRSLPGVNGVEIVQFQQQFCFGQNGRGFCPRALLKVSAPKTSLPDIKRLGYASNIFCHESKHFAMQALMDNTIRNFDQCGQVYCDLSGYKAVNVFDQYDKDRDLIEHYFDVLRNIFAHGSEKGFAKWEVLAKTRQW